MESNQRLMVLLLPVSVNIKYPDSSVWNWCLIPNLSFVFDVRNSDERNSVWILLGIWLWCWYSPGILIIPQQQYRKQIYHSSQQNTSRCNFPLAKKYEYLSEKIVVITQKKKDKDTNVAANKKRLKSIESG